MNMFVKKRTKLYLKSVRPECFLSSKNVSKDVKKNKLEKLINYKNPSIHFTPLCFVKHSGRTGLGIITLIILSISFSILPFSYDSVIYTAQNGDIKSADQQMRSIVVNSPDDADVLYDAGVLAHQLNNYSEAAAYFNRSSQCSEGHDKDLCFRAHFNAGNAYVDNKDLRLALEHYDKALAIDPDSEYARHNRERVAQMLQEQEQQQDQQNDEQKNQENDNDQQNKDKQSDDKNDQQKNDGDDQKQENDQQQNNDSQKNGSDQKSDQKSQGKQGKGSDNNSTREQGAEDGNADQKQDNSANNQERDSEQKFDKKSERAQNEREIQQGKQHEKAPEQENKTKSENSISPDDRQEQQKNASKAEAQQAEIDSAQEEDGSQKWGQKIDDPWLKGILDDQELHDKEVNKKLMEAKIRQHGGKNGQNCW